MGKRLLGVFLVCVLALAAVPGVCLACSCWRLSPDEAIARSEVIFRGRLIRSAPHAFRSYNPDGSFRELVQLRAVFMVDTVWKGPAVPLLSVAQEVVTPQYAPVYQAPLGDCGTAWYGGAEYLVFAYWQSGQRDAPLVLREYSCGTTRETKDAAAYLRALGPGMAVATTASATTRLAGGVTVGAFEAVSPATTRGLAVPALNPPGRLATVFTDFGFVSSVLAVGQDGYVYSADYAPGSIHRRRILKFAPDGELVAIWAGAARDDVIDEFTNVYSLAVDGAGGVYLSGSFGVSKLDLTGRPLANWRLYPYAFSPDANLLLAGSADTFYILTPIYGLRQFSASGEQLSGWPADRRTVADGHSAAGMAVDRLGNLYVTLAARAQVRKYSPSGELLAEWGGEGDGPGEFNYPYGIGVDRWGNVYVADHGNDRVQQFSASGQFIAAWGGAGSGPGQFRHPSGLAVDGRGDVYVVDSGNFRIQRIPAARAP